MDERARFMYSENEMTWPLIFLLDRKIKSVTYTRVQGEIVDTLISAVVWMIIIFFNF